MRVGRLDLGGGVSRRPWDSKCSIFAARGAGDRLLSFNLPGQVKRSMAAILASRNFQVGRITFPGAEKYVLTIAPLRRDREQDSSKTPADFVGKQKSNSMHAPQLAIASDYLGSPVICERSYRLVQSLQSRGNGEKTADRCVVWGAERRA
jgi:hypothetical protein